jgi:thioredoxin reductase (NADPH)
MRQPIEHLVIVGSGPAGWSCAIYAARANLSPLVYEGAISPDNQARGTLPLGQLNLTTEVENYAGFEHGIMGPDLMLAMRAQAERFGTRIVTADVRSVDLSRRPFTLVDSDGKTVRTRSMVIATGASANYLNIPSEQKYKNLGVSACAVCDGALPRFRNRPIAVIGGGDSACEEAAFLSRFASKVYLVHRRDTLRASRIMADRVLKNLKVEPVWNSVVDEVIGDEERGMTALRVRHAVTGETRLLESAGMFVAIGHTPNTGLLNGQLKTDEKGFIVLADPFRTTTNIEGVFAAGDVADPVYKQAITAAGMGCKAALDAERWLEANPD